MNIALVSQIALKLDTNGALGAPIRSEADLALAVGNRLPLGVLKGLAASGISESEIDAFVIPHRTRRHRADKGQPLTVEKLDNAVRLLRVQTLAEEHWATPTKRIAGCAIR